MMRHARFIFLLPVLPLATLAQSWVTTGETSPVKVFGGYGAPLDIAKAARSGVPGGQQRHGAECHQHSCAHPADRLFAGIEAVRPAERDYAGFFGSGCDCFAF